jgi:putative transposase/transposase-like zinc-binding protein
VTGCSAAGQAKIITLGEVLRAALPALGQARRLPGHIWKVLHALCACHTQALGGHLYACQSCGKEHFAPNSCGNRHCPSCQKLQSAQWLDRQIKHVLPIPYFHVVFTLPHSLNGLIQHNQTLLYNLLFASASATLLEFGRNNLQATLGITAVLHTWSQTLLDHYHLHCVVTGGGLSLDGRRWIARSPKWLFPTRALSLVFRAKFRDGLQQLFQEGKLAFPKAEPSLAQPLVFARYLRQACRPQWVVYTKRPFAGPEAFLAYLCRYTHRVAISNSRIECLDRQKGTVTFHYKDYSQAGRQRQMTLTLPEFLRRFCLHILPPRLVKIRHYGLLSNRDRSQRIEQARALLAQAPSSGQEPGCQPNPVIQEAPLPRVVCPFCGSSQLVLIATFGRPHRALICDSS